eukprot:12408359-Karenia_brevis.AAC.1
MFDMTRNTPVLQAVDEINLEAATFWRAIEVTFPEGFKDPWARDFGSHRPEDDHLGFICDLAVQPSFEEEDL